MSDTILCERVGAVGIITLNRPEAMNALSKEMRSALHEAIVALNADDAIRALVLTGAGDRAFTAGLDLKELGADAAAMAAATATSPQENPARAVEQSRKPVIGAINGVAITGGFEVALACDVIIASTKARFADTHARVGIMPGWGLSQKLSRLIGIYRARELSFTGNFLDAATAEAWGLVNRVVEPEALRPTAIALANDMASAHAPVLLAYKELINRGFETDLAGGLVLEHGVSSALNAGVSPDEIAARRGAVQSRGRSQ